jgi:sulfatase maturation enzyme AslB (radical SAM superfamily)
MEKHGISSYRTQFNARKSTAQGIQFIDIRNSNLCNIKCRVCGPSNSSRWNNDIVIKEDISDYKKFIVSASVQSIYYTGGEPFINVEHWELLQELVHTGYSKNINLVYNSNLTTLKFKDLDIFAIWKNFKSVSVMASIDAVGAKFNYIRSGADFNKVEENLKLLKQAKVRISIATTVSILNLWFIEELLVYFKDYQVTLTDLYYPDYFSLRAIPDSLTQQALTCVDKIAKHYKDQGKIEYFREQINNNTNQQFFNYTLLHVLVFDKVNNENLFDLLPFKQEAIARAFENI